MDDGFVDRLDQFGIVFPDADVGIGEVFVGREGSSSMAKGWPRSLWRNSYPDRPSTRMESQLSGAEGVDQLPIGRKTDDFSHVDPVTPEEDLLLRMILDANAFPFQAFGADGHAARKPQIDGTGVVVAVGEIHIRQPLFVFGKPGNDHVQLAPAHFFEQRAESKGLDRAGTAHGLAQRLSDLRVESGLRALGGKGEGRIIVFHADAEDFLGSAAGREPREQQREEEPSQKNGPE